jgi:hypothetical protein
MLKKLSILNLILLVSYASAEPVCWAKRPLYDPHEWGMSSVIDLSVTPMLFDNDNEFQAQPVAIPGFDINTAHQCDVSIAGLTMSRSTFAPIGLKRSYVRWSDPNAADRMTRTFEIDLSSAIISGVNFPAENYPVGKQFTIGQIILDGSGSLRTEHYAEIRLAVLPKINAVPQYRLSVAHSYETDPGVELMSLNFAQGGNPAQGTMPIVMIYVEQLSNGDELRINAVTSGSLGFHEGHLQVYGHQISGVTYGLIGANMSQGEIVPNNLNLGHYFTTAY